MSDLISFLRERAIHTGDKFHGEVADEIEALECSLKISQEKHRLCIARVEDEVRDAHYEGYMAGVGDSEDYDHDPTVMEKEAWAEYEETDDE
jgi:hypothetical protein